jgi:exodeoxyribonuclease VII large subunit
VQVVIYPCSVQGKDAPVEIVAAIRRASQRAKDLQETELLLLVRGGGAIEDLWAFNDEAVARAIAASHVPIISGVGHETDTTIADFVADLRAATPTAAAELATLDRDVLLADIDYFAERLQALQDRRIYAAQQTLDSLTARLQSPSRQWHNRNDALNKNAARLLLASKVQLQRLDARLGSAASRLRFPSLQAKEERLLSLRVALASGLRQSFVRKQQSLHGAAQALELLGPPSVLARGYAIVQTDNGAVVAKIAQAQPGAQLKVILSDGEVKAIVR